MSEFSIEPIALNVSTYGRNPFPYHDDMYPIPENWLMANARRFHFTNDEILAAGIDQFPGDPWSVERWQSYPKISGVYFLIRNGDVIYVGQSNCIPRRLFQHRGNGVEFDAVTWFEAPEFFQKDIEAYYIRRFAPVMNIDSSGHYGMEAIFEQFDN